MLQITHRALETQTDIQTELGKKKHVGDLSFLKW